METDKKKYMKTDSLEFDSFPGGSGVKSGIWKWLFMHKKQHFLCFFFKATEKLKEKWVGGKSMWCY